MAGFLNLWSKTAASNSNSDSTINWAEGQLPSTVNGSARAEMAAIASWRDDINGSLTTAGSSNAYTVTTNIAFTSLATGLMIAFTANHTNTGAATLNANSLGAKALRSQEDRALDANQIISGGKYYALYDSTFNSSNGAWVVLNPTRRTRIAVIREEQTSGTAGGTFTSGADRTRVLNYEASDPDGIVSVSSDQFTLQAGTWLIEWTAPAYRVDQHQSFLYNATDTTEVARGSSEFSANAVGAAATRSVGRATVTITGAKAFEIRHRGTTTQATNGFGDAASFGTEVYTEVVITSYAQ
jgi:hypothetical protein